MSEAAIVHFHEDLEVLKRDLAIVKHILSEEGKLTTDAEHLLEEARTTPETEYIKHGDLKKRIFS